MKTKLKWYSVKERLPEVNTIVFVRRNKLGFQVSNFGVIDYTRWGFNLNNVTHWAYLPDDKPFGPMLGIDDEEEDGV